MRFRKPTTGPQALQWKAAISTGAEEAASVLRQVLDRRGVPFERSSTQKQYDRFTLAINLPRYAYAYRFELQDPGVTVDLFDTEPTLGGSITFIDVLVPDPGDRTAVRNILLDLVKALPRKPWDFPTGQRLSTGYLLPEFVKARRQWLDMLKPSRSRRR